MAKLVRERGLEPPQPIRPLAPQASASTDSATRAHLFQSTSRVYPINRLLIKCEAYDRIDDPGNIPFVVSEPGL